MRSNYSKTFLNSILKITTQIDHKKIDKLALEILRIKKITGGCFF